MIRCLRRICAENHPARFLISRILWQLGLLDLLPLKIKRDGYRLHLAPSVLSVALWVDKNDRAADSDILQRLLKPGDHYVDIGANIGHLAIEARLLVGPSGQVTAIEAHPRTANFLRKNLDLNGLCDIKVANIACGETPKWVRFSDARCDDQNAVVNTGEGIIVPCLPLDCIGIMGPIALLKLDVEGYEKYVFAGARETLVNADLILFEAWDEHFTRYNYVFSDIADFLHKLGFELGVPSSDGVEIISRNFSLPSCINLLAFRSRATLSQRSGWKIREP